MFQCCRCCTAWLLQGGEAVPLPGEGTGVLRAAHHGGEQIRPAGEESSVPVLEHFRPARALGEQVLSELPREGPHSVVLIILPTTGQTRGQRVRRLVTIEALFGFAHLGQDTFFKAGEFSDHKGIAAGRPAATVEVFRV